MNEVSEIGSGVVRLSISQIAREFGMSRNTISSYIENCSVLASGKRIGYPVYRLADVLGLLTATSASDATVDPSKLRPSDRNAWYQSELRRMETLMKAGRLIPAAEHEADLADMTKAIVQFCETLPDQLERDCALSPEQVEAMHDAIDKQRQVFYERIVTDGNDHPAALAHNNA